MYYTVIKTRDDKNENSRNVYINLHDFITPHQYVGIKPRETILK